MSRIYKRGFYGGKFLPFHAGHKYCIKTAANECEEAVIIFFSDSEEEYEILSDKKTEDEIYLHKDYRIKAIKKECEKYDNVRFVILDCRIMHKDIRPGQDKWDAETEYVMKEVGDFQAVYSSEPSYDDYFKRAYPFAVHRLVDPPRIHVPISGTKIREMSKSEAEKWL